MADVFNIRSKRMDPGRILESEAALRKIEAVCKRRFSDENEIDECCIFVMDGLRADNYKRLRSFKGRSSLKTYLHALINSLAVDYYRKKYGRKRFPRQIQKLGEWAEAVYRWICWQKHSFDDAYEFLLLKLGMDWTYTDYLKRVEPIRQAPCPENPKFISSNAEKGGKTRDSPGAEPNPLDALIEKLDRNRRIEACRAVKEAVAGFSDKDRLLIKLVFGSDQSVAAAARAIGLAAPAARGRLKKLQLRIKEFLLAKGIRKP